MFITCLILIFHQRNKTKALAEYNDHKIIGFQARLGEYDKEVRKLRREKKLAQINASNEHEAV